jgi:uncharacterized protein YjbJ (UPF0337 family)
MNKDRVVGTMNDVMGSAKRKVGNLTGNTGLKVEGAVQQVKGKIQNTWGNVKDSTQDARAKLNSSPGAKLKVAAARRKASVASKKPIN